MAVKFYMNFQKDVSSLVVTKSFIDATTESITYALNSLPNYLSINVDADITIMAPLLFLQFPDCYCFETVDPSTGSSFEYDSGPFINPETVVYFDIEGVYMYAGLPVPPLQGSLPSLNGDGCEYIDGDTLIVVGRDYPMTVLRSSRILVSDNSYTVAYDLVGDNGAKVTAPENLVSRYVAPAVTTP